MHCLVVVLDDGSGVSHVGSLVRVLTPESAVLVLLFVHILILSHIRILLIMLSLMLIVLCSKSSSDFIAIALLLPVSLVLNVADYSQLDI